MIETQAELRAALEKNREQMKKIKLLEVAQDAKVESSQLEELQTKVRKMDLENQTRTSDTMILHS